MNKLIKRLSTKQVLILLAILVSVGCTISILLNIHIGKKLPDPYYKEYIVYKSQYLSMQEIDSVEGVVSIISNGPRLSGLEVYISLGSGIKLTNDATSSLRMHPNIGKQRTNYFTDFVRRLDSIVINSSDTLLYLYRPKITKSGNKEYEKYSFRIEGRKVK